MFKKNLFLLLLSLVTVTALGSVDAGSRYQFSPMPDYQRLISKGVYSPSRFQGDKSLIVRVFNSCFDSRLYSTPVRLSPLSTLELSFGINFKDRSANIELVFPAMAATKFDFQPYLSGWKSFTGESSVVLRNNMLAGMRLHCKENSGQETCGFISKGAVNTFANIEQRMKPFPIVVTSPIKDIRAYGQGRMIELRVPQKVLHPNNKSANRPSIQSIKVKQVGVPYANYGAEDGIMAVISKSVGSADGRYAEIHISYPGMAEFCDRRY